MAQPQQKREAEASQKCAQLFKTRLDANQGHLWVIFFVEYRKEEEMTRSFLPLLSMLKFVMVSPTEKAVSFRDNFDGASRSRDLVQKNMGL
jgi:hypothetical protein